MDFVIVIQETVIESVETKTYVNDFLFIKKVINLFYNLFVQSIFHLTLLVNNRQNTSLYLITYLSKRGINRLHVYIVRVQLFLNPSYWAIDL